MSNELRSSRCVQITCGDVSSSSNNLRVGWGHKDAHSELAIQIRKVITITAHTRGMLAIKPTREHSPSTFNIL